MARSLEKLCGACDIKHIREAAIVWCTWCDEGLCSTCLEHHKTNKTSRNHQPIPVSEYKSIESLMKTVQHECKIHAKKFDFYCTIHYTPCCVTCVTESHKQCQGLKPIDEISHQCKSSSELLDIEQGWKELENTLQTMKSHHQTNLHQLKEQKVNILKEIKSTRLKLSTFLDGLEAEITRKLSETCDKEENKINEFLVEIKDKEENIKQMESAIHQMKQSLSDCQLFLATQQLRARLSEEEKWAADTCFHEKAKRTSVQLQAEHKLESILFDVKSFGEIQVIRNPFEIKVGAWKQEQAQMNVSTSAAKQIDKTLHLMQSIEFEELGHIMGCTLFSDGRMIFADYKNKKVLVHKRDGALFKTIPVASSPCGLTMIDSQTVAVSFLSDTGVQIIDVDSGCVTKTIKISNGCSGLSYYSGKLYVLVKEMGIVAFSVEGNLIRTIPVDVPTIDGYLSCYQGGLCYTTYDPIGKKCMMCCDWSGKVKWESEIGNSGVVVDNHGNIFVTNCDNHTLYMLSSGGKQQKCVLSQKDGLENPEGVSYDRTNNTLLVVTNRKRSSVLIRLND